MKHEAMPVRATSYLLGITTMLALAGCDVGNGGPGTSPTPNGATTSNSAAPASISVADLNELAPVTGSTQAPIHWEIPDGLSKREQRAVAVVQTYEALSRALADATGEREQRLLDHVPLVAAGKALQIIESSLGGRHDPAVGPIWNLVGPVSNGPSRMTVTLCQDLGWRGSRSDPVTEPPGDDREDVREVHLVKDDSPGLRWKVARDELTAPQEGAPGFEGTCAAWGTHQPQRP
jgi:hypothetical protein